MTRNYSNTITIKTSDLSAYEKTTIKESASDKIQKTILIENLRNQINILFSNIHEILNQIESQM
jgi:hypothetical protein